MIEEQLQKYEEYIFQNYLRTPLSEIQEFLKKKKIDIDCYQIESFVIAAITRTHQFKSSGVKRSWNIWISGDYVVSSTFRDRDYWTVTNRSNQKMVNLSAKTSEMIRNYPITERHTKESIL